MSVMTVSVVLVFYALSEVSLRILACSLAFHALTFERSSYTAIVYHIFSV